MTNQSIIIITLQVKHKYLPIFLMEFCEGSNRLHDSLQNKFNLQHTMYYHIKVRNQCLFIANELHWIYNEKKKDISGN